MPSAKQRAAAKRNIKKAHAALRKRGKRGRRKNPVIVGRRNKWRGRRYNPRMGKALTQAFTVKNIVTTSSGVIGFVGGIKLQGALNKVEFLAKMRRFSGAIPFALGTVAAVMVKNRNGKAAGAGLAMSGMYDLLTQNVPQLKLMTIEGIDLDQGVYDGVDIDMEGVDIDMAGEDAVEIVGDDDGEDAIVVGYAGDDEDNPYEMI